MWNKFRVIFVIFLLTLTILELTVCSSLATGTISPSVDPNSILWGKYRETDYVLEPPSSVEYIERHANGGTVQTYYGTYMNTSVSFFSDEEFTGKFEGYSLSNKAQNQVAYFDMYKTPISWEQRTVISLNDHIRSYLSKTEYGNYSGNYPTQNDTRNAKVGDSWTYTREERYYENGQYNETSTVKYEFALKDFPTKVVSAGAFSTIHTEATIWSNNALSMKYDRWTRFTDGKLIAYEQYYWDNDNWNISTKTELVSETDGNINLPIEDSRGFSTYYLIAALGVTLPLVSFLVYRASIRNSVRLRQERERLQTEQLERERLEKERVEREQRNKERQERERQEQNYAQSRRNLAPTTLNDLFEVLGVPINASKSQVRAAFLKLTQEWHPDKFAKHGDPKIMELANENYVRIKNAYEEINRLKGWT